MANGYHYRGGPYELDTKVAVTADAIDRADALKHTSGELTVLTAAAKNQGIALQAKDASTAGSIQFLRIYPDRTKFLATTKANSLAAADLHQYAPMSGTTGAMGIDATPTAAGDWYIYSVISTGTSGDAIVVASDPGMLNALD